MGICQSTKSEKEEHSNPSDNKLIYVPKNVPTDMNIQAPKRIATTEKISKEDYSQVKELVGILKQNTFQRDNLNFNNGHQFQHNNIPRVNTENKLYTSNLPHKVNIITNPKSEQKYQREDFYQIKELAKLTKQGTNFQDFLNRENKKENGQMNKWIDIAEPELPEFKDLKKESELSYKPSSSKNLQGLLSKQPQKFNLINNNNNLDLIGQDPSKKPDIIQEEFDTPYDEPSIDNEINPAAIANIDIKSITCNKNELNKY